MNSLHLDIIEKFLRNELSPEEEQHLAELRKDPRFQEELEFQTELFATLSDSDILEFVQKVKAIHTPAKKSKRWIWYAAAACIAVIVVASVVFSQPKDLYADNFEPYESRMLYRGYADGKDLEQLYEQGQYVEFNTAYAQIDSRDRTQSLDLMYINSLMVADRHAEALQVIEGQESIAILLQEHFDWYESLCQLKLNDTARACYVLTQLESTWYAERAEKLRSDIGCYPIP